LPSEYFYNAYVTLFEFDERVYVQPLAELGHDPNISPVWFKVGFT